MKNNIIKILIILVLFNTKVFALEVGDKITVEGHPGEFTVISADKKYRCDLSNQKEPDPFKVTSMSDSESETIGYTYENLCTNVASKTISWCSRYNRCDTIKGLYNADTSINKDNKDNNIQLLSTISKSKSMDYTFSDNDKHFILMQVDYKPGDADPTDAAPVITDPGSGGATKINCTDNVDYYEHADGTVSITCYKPDSMNCSCGYSCDKKGCTYGPNECACNDSDRKTITEETTVEGVDPNGSCNTVTKNDYIAPLLAAASSNCPDGYNETGRELTRLGVMGPVYYSTGSTTTRYCEKVEPHRVDVYANELEVHSKSGVKKEAYCINPALNPISNFAWDTSFDPNKCVDSLHSLNKKGQKVFDYECGYVYILAEAKRINAEIGKEIFNYSSISTAMRLFGTGITGNGNNLLKEAGFSDIEEKFLMAGGYYYTYKSWGLNEWIGIMNPRNARNLSGRVWSMDTSWPAAYRWWMPELASIYIRTAKNSDLYLQNTKVNDKNIRYTDVGKHECVSDINTTTHKCKGIDGKEYYYSYSSLDKKNYIIDATYYLNYKNCNMSYESCKCETKVIDLDIGADDKFNEELGSWPPDDTENTSTCVPDEKNTPCRSGNVSPLRDFITQGTGRETKCTCKDGIGGLGVICGGANNDEKIISDSNYLDALYLYMRALQSNKIVYETKIDEKIQQYTPVEGLTKVIYTTVDGETLAQIRYKIDSQSSKEEVEVDCDVNDPDTKDLCEVKGLYIYDSDGNLLEESQSYDYCKKNYCYYTIKGKMKCDLITNTNKITSLVITDLNALSATIKKLGNANKKEQILYVYDDTLSLTGNYCQNIEAVEENMTYKCPCNPEDSPNVLEPTGNIKNQCSKAYDAYDEMYYGDPSMSTIINACYEEDKLKYDFTEDLNINGNDIVYEAELESKYSFQVKSDDFGVCKLYCRDETRFYIGNKLSVKAGQNLKYDIGQKLLDKKIINETAGKKNNNQHNYMPSVVLQLRECTSEINYNKWKSLYNNAKTEKQKNQLLYSIYNCNLYTTQDILEKINNNDIKYNIINENATTYESLNGYAEPAMIKYKYNTNDGTISIVNFNEIFKYGTTKDYLLAQEGCTSLGLTQTECANYFLNHYSDDYYNKDSPDNLGITLDFEHGLVNSNLNETIYCTGESCYKLKGKDGKYYYNPNAKNKNDYTTVDNIYNGSGDIVRYESGKILSYQEWGLNYKKYDKNSTNYKKEYIDGNEVPANKYASFIVVTETGFYNKQKYYSDSYSGIIRNEPNQDATIKSVELDKNIFPLHLDKQTGTYEISHKFDSIRTAYKRSTYYTEKNYSLFDKINNKPGTIDFICEYDVYNTTTKYECESGNCKRELGFIYRAVDLNDVFESVTNESRQYPENWATSFAQTTLNQIQASSQNILEQEKNNDDNDSYLEYSYTLTPDGIKRIREYNKTKLTDGGYLDTSMYGCQYDDEEGIFYNCKSKFLLELESLNGKYDGLITVNKNDGVSEFCSNTHNEDKDYCKYQQKYKIGILNE